jgi:hypothetical protein
MRAVQRRACASRYSRISCRVATAGHHVRYLDQLLVRMLFPSICRKTRLTLNFPSRQDLLRYKLYRRRGSLEDSLGAAADPRHCSLRWSLLPPVLASMVDVAWKGRGMPHDLGELARCRARIAPHSIRVYGAAGRAVGPGGREARAIWARKERVLLRDPGLQATFDYQDSA